MHEFKVGSYVWFVRNDKPGVRHYLVVEEIVKRSIDGTSRDYLFETEAFGKVGRVQSKNLSGDYFIDKDDAYSFMLKQAGVAISRMMDTATYSKDSPVSVENKPLLDEETLENTGEDTIVELPDGTKARLKGGIPK